MEIIEQTKELSLFIERNTNLKMSELVVDYIKDTANIYWFIGEKAFKIEETHAKPVLRAFLPN